MVYSRDDAFNASLMPMTSSSLPADAYPAGVLAGDRAAVRVARSPAAARRTIVILALTVAGLTLGELPLLWKFFIDLWQRPQYQFFPLVLLAAPFMAAACLEDVPADDVRPGSLGIAITLWMLAWTTLAVGAAAYWKWMAPVSTLLLLAGCVWKIGGGRLLRALVPVGMILALLIPPPGHYDDALLVALRKTAVACSGRVLDAVGVPIFLQGAVIQIPGERLMVEEACSGINSMLAVLCFTVMLSFWKRLPRLWLVLLLPAAFAYVFWANVLRISMCAFAKQRWGIDLLSGGIHELLGVLLFVGCMGLVISTVQLVQILSARPAITTDATHDVRPHTISHRSAGGSRAWVILAGVFALTGIGVYARTAAAWPVSQLPGGASFNLPRSIAGWTQVDRDAEIPERAEVSGHESHLWQYQLNGRRVTIGLDYPFYGYHDATTCYVLAGWKILSTAEGSVDAGGRQPFAVAMEKPPLAQGSLLFALCDEKGVWWQRPADHPGESSITTDLRLAHERALASPLVQVQALSVEYQPMNAAQRADVQRLFNGAADAVRAEIRTRPWTHTQ